MRVGAAKWKRGFHHFRVARAKRRGASVSTTHPLGWRVQTMRRIRYARRVRYGNHAQAFSLVSFCTSISQCEIRLLLLYFNLTL